MKYFLQKLNKSTKKHAKKTLERGPCLIDLSSGFSSIFGWLCCKGSFEKRFTCCREREHPMKQRRRITMTPKTCIELGDGWQSIVIAWKRTDWGMYRGVLGVCSWFVWKFNVSNIDVTAYNIHVDDSIQTFCWLAKIYHLYNISLWLVKAEKGIFFIKRNFRHHWRELPH